MNLLSIDYGQSRVGLAVSFKNIISPYCCLTNQGQKKTAKEILRICQEENIDRLVLGLPEGRLQDEIKQFGKRLEEVVELPVVFVNEVMTSKQALKKIGKVKDKEKVDQVAAAFILQRYLDEQVID